MYTANDTIIAAKQNLEIALVAETFACRELTTAEDALADAELNLTYAQTSLDQARTAAELAKARANEAQANATTAYFTLLRMIPNRRNFTPEDLPSNLTLQHSPTPSHDQAQLPQPTPPTFLHPETRSIPVVNPDKRDPTNNFYDDPFPHDPDPLTAD